MLNKKALAGTPSTPPVFVEDVFSTYLYTGTGATQTITNGIDLSGKGGLTWIKGRSGATGHRLTDTVRGATKSLASNTSDAEATESTGLTAFGSTGFTIGADADYNTSAATYCSWTFRKQAKFFDIVTWAGNSVNNRMIPHNLGSTPGCIIVRRVDDSASWYVWHRSLTSGNELKLNDTGAEGNFIGANGFTTVNATEFSTDDGTMNASGYTFIAYLFAHDAGGFGTAGTDNVISCGSYTGTGSTLTVTLGYEIQWLLVKRTDDGANAWVLMDMMRGLAITETAMLFPNSSSAETSGVQCNPTATGFQITSTGSNLNNPGSTYIYIAIRRGPMKTPTSGTSVFVPVQSVVSTGTQRTIGFPADATFSKTTVNAAASWGVEDRLRGYARTNNIGQSPALNFNTQTAEDSSNLPVVSQVFNTTYVEAGSLDGAAAVIQSFRRAPGFFDIVCYTGTGSNTTQAHNLGVVPELIIVKCRSTARSWDTYTAPLGNTKYLAINLTAAEQTSSVRWNNTSPTSSVFSLGTSSTVNASADTYVSYLFATLAGVSKVGSYTGTGTTQTINCGFTAGSRFILIKRTDSTGDWYVWDSARGIVAGNDPYLLLNSTAAEVTNTDYIDPANSGFEISSTAPAAINANGGSFIFMAIA